MTVGLRAPTEKLGRFVSDLYNQPPASRRHLTRDEYVEWFGSTESDISAVRRFAQNNGLNVIEAHPGKHTVELGGTVAAMSRAFGVQLSLFRGTGGVFRAPSGPARLPAWLAPLVPAVLGLDTRPIARPHFRLGKVISKQPDTTAPPSAFTPLDVASLYDFPSGTDGNGQCVAIIELGGGFKPVDLTQYFNRLGTGPPPNVEAIPVDGGSNLPTGQPDGPDVEVMLDVEIVGSVAPKANVAVYFGPNNDKGFVAALLSAIHDAKRQPSAISAGWGSPEELWSPQARRMFNQACLVGLAMGVTVFAASGNNGSSDGWPPWAHVDFPASSPFVVGCGGTTLVGNGGHIVSETVWNNIGGGATGGGVSRIFPVPSYQSAIRPQSANPFHGAGRGVPDVAGNADPTTGYQIVVDGLSMVVGGTSAVAALWAGLLARLNQELGHSFAPVEPLLYSNSSVFRDIVSGNNGAYSAATGWNACTGLGSPVGSKLAGALASASNEFPRAAAPAFKTL